MQRFVIIGWLILASTAWASGVALNEKLPGTVTGHLERKKAIRLDRGHADGLKRFQVYRIHRDGKYIARGLVIGLDEQSAVMYLYPTVAGTYILAGKEHDFTRIHGKFFPNRQYLIARYINPNQLDFDAAPIRRSKKDRPDLDETNPKDHQIVVAETNEQSEGVFESDDEPMELLGEDKEKPISIFLKPEEQVERNYRFSIYASPFSFQSVDNSKNVSFGADLVRYHKEKKVVEGFYRYSTAAQQVRETDSTFSQSRYQAGVDVIYKRFAPQGNGGWNTFGTVSFERRRDGSIYPIRSRIGIAPVGVKYGYEQEEGALREFSFSYAPMFERFEQDVERPTGIEQPIKNQARHNLRAMGLWKFRQRYSVQADFWFRPLADFSETNAENEEVFNGTLWQTALTLAYHLGENLSFAYTNRIERDPTIKNVDLRSGTNIINEFSFRYSAAF